MFILKENKKLINPKVLIRNIFQLIKIVYPFKKINLIDINPLFMLLPNPNTNLSYILKLKITEALNLFILILDIYNKFLNK